MPGSKAVRWRIEQLLGQISLLSLDDYPNPTAWLAVVLPPLSVARPPNPSVG
jgi:hypothetical protein